MVYKSFPTRHAFLIFYVVDKTECTNYSHKHCIVYLVIGRSSQDNYPFTSFAAAMGHAKSAIHSLLAC